MKKITITCIVLLTCSTAFSATSTTKPSTTQPTASTKPSIGKQWTHFEGYEFGKPFKLSGIRVQIVKMKSMGIINKVRDHYLYDKDGDVIQYTVVFYVFNPTKHPFFLQVSYRTYKNKLFYVHGYVKRDKRDDYQRVVQRLYGGPNKSSRMWVNNNLTVQYSGSYIEMTYNPIFKQMEKDVYDEREKRINDAVKRMGGVNKDKKEAEAKRKAADKIRKIVNDKVQKAVEKKIREYEARKKKYNQDRPNRLIKIAKMLVYNDAYKSARVNLNNIIKEYPNTSYSKEAKSILDDIKDEM